jgi:hypothetical protein
MAFPTSPADGQLAQQNGIYYIYASATSSWTRQPAVSNSIFSITTNTFTGDGATDSYSLSSVPTSTDFVSVNVAGILQQKSAYTVNGGLLTFTEIPANGAAIEIRTLVASAVSILTGLVYDNFTGDGSTTVYGLATSPLNKTYTMVTVGGITQLKTSYDLAGSILTFTTAPPSTSPIEVVTFGPAPSASDAVLHPFFMMG